MNKPATKTVRNASVQSQAPAQSHEDAGFFNLHLNGLGYLSRVRWVDGKRGNRRAAESFLCCAINAIHGPAEKPNYTYLDLRVSGEEAVEVVKQLKKAVDEDRKVCVAFKVGDIYPHVYDRKVRDDRNRLTGETETAALIKGRLLLITWAKVDDNVVYERPEDDDSQTPAAQAEGVDEDDIDLSMDDDRQGDDDQDDDQAEPEPQPQRTQGRSAPRSNGASQGRPAQRQYGQGARH